jgi:hypothetical protein
MTEAQAQEFAIEWIAAWNSHDLERILGHYADDVEVTSPLVETVKLFRAYAGPRSLVLHYRSVQGLIGAECLELDGHGRIRRVLAHYALGPDPAAA